MHSRVALLDGRGHSRGRWGRHLSQHVCGRWRSGRVAARTQVSTKALWAVALTLRQRKLLQARHSCDVSRHASA